MTFNRDQDAPDLPEAPESAAPRTAIDHDYDGRSFEALRLRLEGVSVIEISTRLGMSVEVVAAALKSAYELLRSEAYETDDQVRSMEEMRLDELVQTHWEFRHLPKHAELILKAQERRAKLRSLDRMPVEVANTAEAIRALVSAAADNIGTRC